MGIKKETPERITAIRRLEATLGFLKGFLQCSENRRAPELSRFMNGVKAICIDFFNDATPDSLSKSEKLKARVQELLDEFGPILWPDSVPDWAFDPSDPKQRAMHSFASDYPKQLRYSHRLERASLLLKLQAYVARKIISHRDLTRRKKTLVVEDASPLEDAEDDDDRSYSDPRSSRSSSLRGPRDTRQSYQQNEMKQRGAPTASMVAETQAERESANAAPNNLKRAQPPGTEVGQSFKRRKDARQIIVNLEMKRGTNEEGEEAQSVGVLIPEEEGVTTTRGLFTTIEEQVEELLAADETIDRVEVKRLSESLTKDLVTDFIMTPNASVKARTWERLIKGLQDDKTGKSDSAEMKLRATVHVRKAIVGR